MSMLVPNSFSTYQLTSQEAQAGSILNTLQKQCIQNQISNFAMARLAIKFDPLNPQGFLQQEAELQGSISALQYLLTLSEAAEQSPFTTLQE